MWFANRLQKQLNLLGKCQSVWPIPEIGFKRTGRRCWGVSFDGQWATDGPDGEKFIEFGIPSKNLSRKTYINIGLLLRRPVLQKHNFSSLDGRGYWLPWTLASQLIDFLPSSGCCCAVWRWGTYTCCWTARRLLWLVIIIIIIGSLLQLRLLDGWSTGRDMTLRF